MRSKLAILFSLGLSLAGISILGFQVTDSQRAVVARAVHGSIHARFDLDNEDDSTVPLPDITVFVRNMDSGSVSQEVKTGVDGHYDVEELAAGRYQLCWKADGWVSDCQADLIVLADDTQHVHKHLSPIRIVPDGRGAIVGHVRLGDGSSCAYSNSLFEVRQNGWVSALDSSGRIVSGPVSVNESGEYVLAGLPRTDVRVRATCANGSVEARVAAWRFAFGTPAPLDLTLNSLPPRFIAMTVQLGGQPVKSVPPGVTVELAVEAQASDADHLQYRWATDSGFGSIVSTSGNHAQWTAPSESAASQIYVLISNDRGGFAQGSIVVAVGQVELGAAAAPPAPYCKLVVENGLNANQEYIPPYASNLDSSRFLTRRTNTEGNNPPKYYRLVDPGEKRTTLAGWWKQNGWNDDGTPQKGKTEARTVFLNNNDLGYVRDMHCIPGDLTPEDFPRVIGTRDVACWVTNYSEANQEVDVLNFPPIANAANLARDFANAEKTPPGATGAKATVVMEYRAADHLVTYFAFGDPVGGKLGAAKREDGSDQDGFGKKPVPGMCNNCHGGNNFSGRANVAGNFIVFDLSTFIFPTDAGWTRRDKKMAFKQQNLAVLATRPRDAVQSLIRGWYGADLSNADAIDNFVPQAWKGTTIVNGPKPLMSDDLYLNVVRTCRTCHTALENTARSWDTYQQFIDEKRSISSFVCAPKNQSRVMAHDCISYLNFWRFVPPGSPPAYPAAPTNPIMMQPFMDMGAFLVANRERNGACKNTKGQLQ